MRILSRLIKWLLDNQISAGSKCLSWLGVIWIAFSRVSRNGFIYYEKLSGRVLLPSSIQHFYKWLDEHRLLYSAEDVKSTQYLSYIDASHTFPWNLPNGRENKDEHLEDQGICPKWLSKKWYFSEFYLN